MSRIKIAVTANGGVLSSNNNLHTEEIQRKRSHQKLHKMYFDDLLEET